MSTDTEDDDVLICTPLQRSRSLISSIQSERKKPPHQFYSQFDKRVNTSVKTEFKIPHSSQQKQKSLGRSRSKPSKSFSKSSSSLEGKIKKEYVPVDVAKRNFLYGSSDSQANNSSSQKRKSLSTVQNGSNKRERKDGVKRKGQVKQEESSCLQDICSVCPNCMMPWNIYLRNDKSKQFHTDECLDRNLSDKPECPKGLECKMVLESHFWSYRHTIQAHLNTRTPASGNMGVSSSSTRGSSEGGRSQHQIVNSRHLLQEQQKTSSKRSPSEDSGYGDQNVVLGPSEVQRSNFTNSSKDQFHSKRLNPDINLSMDSDEEEEPEVVHSTPLFEEESKAVNSTPLFDNPQDLFDQNANEPWLDHRIDTDIADRSRGNNVIGNFCFGNKDEKCGGAMSKNRYQGTKCSSSSDRQDSSSTPVNSTAATKDARVNADAENITTPVTSRRIISKVQSSEHNTAEKTSTESTAKDYSAFLDLPEIPDLELRPVSPSSSTNISDSDSEGRTILFTRSPYIQTGESKGNPAVFDGESTHCFVDPLIENRNVKHLGTANLDHTADTHTSSNSSPTESYSSLSLLKNVSRNLFRENECLVSGRAAQERVNENMKAKTQIRKRERLPDTRHSTDTRSAQRSGHESTESLKLTLERERSSNDSSIISSSINDHIQTVGKEMPRLAETLSDKPCEGNYVQVKRKESSQPGGPKRKIIATVIQEGKDGSRTGGMCDGDPPTNSTEFSQETESENELLPVSRDGRTEDSVSETDVEYTRRCETNRATGEMEGGNSGSDGSETHGQSEAAAGFGNLEDSDEDEMLVSMVEAAVEKYLGDVVDRVRAKRRGSRTISVSSNWSPERENCTTTMDYKQGVGSGVVGELDNSGDRQYECRCSSHKAVHFHLHLNTPSPKKGGQTSILNFFPSSRGSGKASATECSKCSHHDHGNGGGGSGSSRMSAQDNNSSDSKRQGVKEWQELLSKMKGKLKKTPSLTSSVAEGKEDRGEKGDGRVGAGGGSARQRWFGGQTSQRKCPFYKYITGTNVVVDAFCYGVLQGVTAYFLTHFHYDHYRGLSKSFSQPIYCSHITARLVQNRLGVSKKYLHPLPLDKPQQVCGGLEVTLLDANHCPGAVLFFFKLPNGLTVLHTGDFRAHPRMESYPALWNSNIDTLYLDTTYCNPVYDFPSQEEVVEACVSLAQNHIADNPKTLIVVGSYSIGKERVFKAIAAALDCRVWANREKCRTLACLEDTEIHARLTTDKRKARVHVLPMAHLTHKRLMGYTSDLQPVYSVVVAIKPTGWEHSCDAPLAHITPKQIGNVYIYGMPYSEHSSFTELQRFVQFTQPKRIIPTVNVGNPNTRHMMEGHFANWMKNRMKTTTALC